MKDEEEEKSPTPERNNNSISISTSDVHTSDEVGLMDKTLETLKTGEVFAKRRMERKESKFYSFWTKIEKKKLKKIKIEKMKENKLKRLKVKN